MNYPDDATASTPDEIALAALMRRDAAVLRKRAAGVVVRDVSDIDPTLTGEARKSAIKKFRPLPPPRPAARRTTHA